MAYQDLGQNTNHSYCFDYTAKYMRSLVYILTLPLVVFVDISIVSLQGYTAAQLATDAVQEFLREGPLTGGTDVDIQLLEAAKTGDLDLVEVCGLSYFR